MLWLGVTDALYKRLPNKILFAWFVCRLLLVMIDAALNDLDVLLNSFGAAATMFVFFLLVYFLSRQTLGGGDVKYSFVLGLSLTFNLIFLAMFLSLVFSAVYGLIGMALKKMSRKDMVPLGPFFFTGAIVAYLMTSL
jgi:leader peptidase (prepilin peptidase)/N-methyltransferase